MIDTRAKSNTMENNNAAPSVLPTPSQHVVDQMRAQGYNYFNPVTWQGMVKLAKTLIDAQAVPSTLNTEAKVLVALQAGLEVGITPINALNSFYIVDGKITIYGDTAIALVMRAGHAIEWGTCNGSEAEVKITRADNGKSMTGTFTFKQAEDRGLTTYKDGRKNPFWLKYPDNMLKFKAFGSIARFIVPDALHGMQIKEEIEASSIEYEEVTPRFKSVPAPAAEAKQIEAPAPEPVTAPEQADGEEEDEAASLQQFMDKKPEKPAEEPKPDTRLKAQLIHDINEAITNSGGDPKKVLDHYKRKSWDAFTKEELKKVEESVKVTIASKKSQPAMTEAAKQMRIAELENKIKNEEKQLEIAEANPTESKQFYAALDKARQHVQELYDELDSLKKAPTMPKQETAPQAAAPAQQDDSLPTYYMVEEDVQEIVNELLAHDFAELTPAQQKLVNDVSNDQFLGKQHPDYTGAIK